MCFWKCLIKESDFREDKSTLSRLRLFRGARLSGSSDSSSGNCWVSADGKVFAGMKSDWSQCEWQPLRCFCLSGQLWDLLASLISYSLITWILILWIPLNAYLVPQTLQIFLVIKQVRRGIEMPSLQGASPSQTSNFCFLEKKWFQCSQWDRFRFRCFHCCVPRL